jgi:hypothetical protein
MLQLTQKHIGTQLVKLKEDWEHVPRSLPSSRHNDISTWIQICNASLEEQEEKLEIRQTSTSWRRGIRKPSTPTLQGTSLQSHGSVESDNTPTVNARVSCTLDQQRDQIMVKRSRLSMTWGNGGRLPRKQTIGQCVRPKILGQIHGRTKKSNAFVSQSLNMNQAIVEMRVKTVYAMVGLCSVSKKTLMIQHK